MQNPSQLPFIFLHCVTSAIYLYLAGIDRVSVVQKLIRFVMMLGGAQTLVFIVILLVLSSLCWRPKAIGAKALQQRSHSLRLRQFSNLEVLLVVWCVLSDQTLFLHRECRPFFFFITPLTIFAVLLFIIITDPNNGLFGKVHSWLGKGEVLLINLNKQQQ